MIRVESDCYSIQYNIKDNHVLMKLTGNWSKSQMIEYSKDCQMVLNRTKYNFTIMCDLIEISIHEKSILKQHQYIMELCVKYKPFRIALLLSNQKSIIKLVEKLLQDSGLDCFSRIFTIHNMTEILCWLYGEG